MCRQNAKTSIFFNNILPISVPIDRTANNLCQGYLKTSLIFQFYSLTQLACNTLFLIKWQNNRVKINPSVILRCLFPVNSYKRKVKGKAAADFHFYFIVFQIMPHTAKRLLENHPSIIYTLWTPETPKYSY